MVLYGTPIYIYICKEILGHVDSFLTGWTRSKGLDFDVP